MTLATNVFLGKKHIFKFMLNKRLMLQAHDQNALNAFKHMPSMRLMTICKPMLSMIWMILKSRISGPHLKKLFYFLVPKSLNIEYWLPLGLWWSYVNCLSWPKPRFLALLSPTFVTAVDSWHRPIFCICSHTISLYNRFTITLYYSLHGSYIHMYECEHCMTYFLVKRN